MRRPLLYIALVIVACGSGARLWYGTNHAKRPASSVINPSDGPKTPTPSPTPVAFNKKQYSIDEPGSIWWIVNKTRPLPEGYVPPSLVVPKVSLRLSSNAEQMQIAAVVAPHLEALFGAAKVAGYSLALDSGYRSATYQKQLYGSYVAKDGQSAADRYSARPGTSEHQTGLAFDIGRNDGKCSIDSCFATTEEGKWIAAHAHEYGFVVRYQDGKEPITGYQYEPWHLRYVGEALAAEVFKANQTLEEFFGLPAAPDYPKS